MSTQKNEMVMESLIIESTKLPPCNLSRSDQGLIVGTYDLDKSTGLRTGSLDLYDQGLQLINSVPTESAILDNKIVDDKIFTAHSTGEVRIWDMNLKPLSKIVLKDQETLLTQIEPRDHLSASTTTAGESIVYDLRSQQISYEARLHDLEAWTVAWQDSVSLYTGGDDRQLTYTDLRIPYTLWKVQPHEAGITSILPSAGHSNQIWTGGYDDTLNLFNIETRRTMESSQLSGGVWRLIPNTAMTQVMACCMYGGIQLMSMSKFGKCEAELRNHESMVYGGVWIDDQTGVTCSFYDKMLQKWKVK